MINTSRKTSILASFSTMKSLVDAKQYQSPYQILAEFIQYIVIKNNLHSFTAIEMKNRLYQVFGFDVPEAVVRTAIRGLHYIKTEHGLHHVDSSKLVTDPSFEEKKASAEANNSDVIDLLISFVKEAEPSEPVWEDVLTQEFIAYLLDDQQTSSSGTYTDLIGQFILKHEADKKVQMALAAIREGSILYIGLNHNINETGSLRKPLTLFLGTEVLFSLIGYNGDIYKQLADDLFAQIKAANNGSQRITLRYFSDVKREIEDFFTSAEYIVDGKQQMFDTVAMKAIVNGCSTSGDVKIKKADFFHKLQYSYGILEDDRLNYYEAVDDPYNLESLSEDPQQYDSIKLVSHINKLRKGKVFPNILESEYLIVSNSGLTLRVSKEQVERVKMENAIEVVCDYAVSVERLTNILWYKLGNGLGGKKYPTNVNAVLKARMLLSSKIFQNITKLYDETSAQYYAGEITEDQLASRIITLRQKPISPDELTADAIEESMDFSLEYLTRYEEEVKRNQAEAQEKERLVQQLREQNKQLRSQQSNALAQKDQLLQAQQDRNNELEAELEEYRRREEQKKRKKACRLHVIKIVFSALVKLLVAAGIVVASVLICNKVDSKYTNAVSLVVGVFSGLPTIIAIVKKDLSKLKNSESNN